MTPWSRSAHPSAWIRTGSSAVALGGATIPPRRESVTGGLLLDTVVAKSSSLRDASSKYAKDARYLNTRAMLRKYGPLAVVLLLVLAMLYWRFFR